MPSYDAQFDPPAPIARVTLRNRDSGAAIGDQPLLLDTGADVTLLPHAAVERVGIQPLNEPPYELTAFDGSKTFASVAIVDMILLGRAFRGRYLLIQAEQGILGRDVLNHLSLLLDGPAQQWSQVT